MRQLLSTEKATTGLLQKQRFELKYEISESLAQSIRFYCRNHLVPDHYGMFAPDKSYTVNSIYLDSPDGKTFQDTINGNRNRFKLRIRYYNKEGDAPVYLEVKRRHNDVIVKKRAEVKRASVDSIVMGRIPGRIDLVNPSDNQFQNLNEFSRLLNLIRARPAAIVRYRREAWEEEGSNSVRVTFDRSVKIGRLHDPYVSFDADPSTPVFGRKIILELKFTNRFPLWLKEMVQKFDLVRESAAKYVDGLIRIKERNIL